MTAEIANAMVFGEAERQSIEQIQSFVDYSHHSWSVDELETVRSAIRAHYRNEQRGLCAYCRNPVSLQSPQNCHVEHIAPKSKYLGFMFEPKNLCVVCADCNTIKRDQEVHNDEPDTVQNGSRRRQYPRSSAAFRIVHPHFDRWDDHIERFGKYYCDKSAKGHFTIGACILNRQLRQFGWEPAIVDDAAIRELMNEYLNLADPAVQTSVLNRLMRLMIQLQ
ncbi:HNH endonuclease [Cupriavidus campinensis]|uniref:HNH endonuclease n=1 Tax=Cupriavidus campinensis TaxID=151783 RepID=A0AAE9HYS8_9BURK|nr:HNH endonuclease [Cupriavidus campinensis]URF03969.1 HNH endonuclease [Cupriavidus campinensis]